MPNHPELRDAVEAEIVRRLRIIGPGQRAALADDLLAREDPRKIPAATWRSIERELARELYWPLFWAAHGAGVGVWGELGWPDPGDDREPLPPEDRPGRGDLPDLPPLPRGAEADARRWVGARTSKLAAGLVATAQKRLEQLRFSLRRTEGVTEASVRNPRTGRFAAIDPSGVIDLFDRQPQYARLLDELYGDDRWRLIAETETTGSIVAGEVAILRTLEKNRGWKFDMLWKTQVDERRCPICRPLHNKHRDYFARRVGFPPAHVKCRCYLSYRVLSKPKGAPGVSRKAATKMPATTLRRPRRRVRKKSA